MTRPIMLFPLGNSVGIKIITLGLIKVFQRRKLSISFFQPLSNNVISNNCLDTLLNIVKCNKSINYIPSIDDIDLHKIYNLNEYNLVMDKIFEQYHLHISNSDVAIINGLSVVYNNSFLNKINYDIAFYLNAEIIFVSILKNHRYFNLRQEINMIEQVYGINKHLNILGVVINKLENYINKKNHKNDLIYKNHCISVNSLNNDIDLFIKNSNVNLLASIPFNSSFKKTNLSNIHNLEEFIADCFHKDWIQSFLTVSIKNHNLSSIAFRYKLRTLSKKALLKKIILPEGHEPRIIKAAVFCSNNYMADCILLGDPTIISNVASKHNIHLGKNITIINPRLIDKNYVNLLIELRKNQGMDQVLANKQIKNNIILGTLMLKNGDVDGLVAGAITSTADSIRPGLQLIKMAKNYSLVSSAFFMLSSNRVCIYADCAINPDPDYKQLSEIAIQSVESSILFGIKPKIAMISYSTGNSGFGKKVEIVKKAVSFLKKKYPNLIIDGPIQYDAAMNPNIAKIKLPGSLVAGNATILIFPDLNTGNATYKAVQNSSNIICIGPMLQGLKKPINDLSRGSSVEDIIYTILLTVVQANNFINVKNKII